MQYKRNYLKNVIFRIDFEQPMPSSAKSIDVFYNLIKEIFPKRESIKRVIVQASITNKKDSNRVTQSQKKVISYKFTDEASKKILMLEPLDPSSNINEPSSNINLSLSIYKNSLELRKIISIIIDAMIKVYGDLQVKRTGLRYINDIILPEGDPFDWDTLINSSLSSYLNFPVEKRAVARGMGVIELIEEDYNVLFQFGMYNPEYPNPIARREFILDYDCYTTENINLSRINKIVESLQKGEEALFERSISNGLRDIMGVEKDV